MTYETKEQQRERFLAGFLQRVREAPPGTRVYMAVGDLFKDADIHNIEELRAARRGAVVHNDKDEGEDGFIESRTALISKAKRLRLCGS